MRKTITVNGKSFKTKKALREHIQTLRNRYPGSKHLNTADFEFMLDLLKYHEHAEMKIGCGVVSMYVKTNEFYKNSREFWLVRSDGSETDFSYIACLKTTTKLQRFKNACRLAIAPTIVEFKRNLFKRVGSHLICPLSGETINFYNSHVDHTAPTTFDRIILDFIEIHKIKVDEVEILSGQDGLIGDKIADEELERRFIKFHNLNADLRVIGKVTHRKLPKFFTE